MVAARLRLDAGALGLRAAEPRRGSCLDSNVWSTSVANRGAPTRTSRNIDWNRRVSEGEQQARGGFVEGEVIRLDDRVTDFDLGKIGRPNCIVRLIGDPLQQAYVVPRTTDGSIGTFTPAGALPGLNKPGRFLYLPRLVLPADLEGCESLGVLPEQLRTLVLGNVNWAATDLDL